MASGFGAARFVQPNSASPLSRSCSLPRFRMLTIDTELVHTVIRETGGNPLFVVAVADAMRAGEDARSPHRSRCADTSFAGWPASTPAACELSKAAAVLGDEAPTQRCHSVGRSQAGPGLVAAAELVQANILAATDPFVFAHGIIRMAIYSVLEPGERLTFHSRAAKLLAERRRRPKRSPSICMKSGTVDQEWAVGALHEAGRASTRKGAPAAAIRYLRHAVESSDANTVPPRLLIDLGLAEAAAGEPTSLDRFAQALEMVTDPGERADALYSLGQTLHAIGRYRRGERRISSRRGTRRERRHSGVVALSGRGGQRRVFHHYPRQTNAGPDHASDDFADGSGTRVMLAVKSLQEVVSVPPARWAGDWLCVLSVMAPCLPSRRHKGPASISRCWLSCMQADSSEAQNAADAAVRDARERGALLAHVEACYVRALVLYARGQITEAAADAQAALDGLDWCWHDHRQRAVAILLQCMVERDELNEAASLIERADQELPCRPPEAYSRCCIWRGPECMSVSGTSTLRVGRSRRRRTRLRTTGRSTRPLFRGDLSPG